ncbi:MAG: adenylate/guanylate cyclase domain-containing protein [Treponema sp.]|nr:adenylate/guanylate cyclase domain-containing protein [Treponema sp.]
MSKKKVKFPISFKLITIFSFLVILVLGISTAFVYYYISTDEGIKAEENNHTINSRTAQTVQSLLVNVQGNVNGYLNSLTLLDQDENFEQKKNLLFNDLILRNPEIAFIYNSEIGVLASSDFQNAHSDCGITFSSWLENNKNASQKIKAGKIEVYNVSQMFQEPLICVLFPHINPQKNQNEICAVVFEGNKYTEILSTGSFNTSFIINDKADILVHPDSSKVINQENISSLPAIHAIFKENGANKQNLFPDETGYEWYYANESILGGTMYVITCVAKQTVFETINRTTYRIILFSLIILFLAIIIIRIFSRSLTRPIEKLVNATEQINSSDYDIKLKAKTKDEIGYLTNSFKTMAGGLAERQRLMSSFSKFTNRIIAEKAAADELELGGVNKNATIFFSDIRSFTAMSEKLNPEEVVEFLNDYMTRMVKCVTKTGGIVDKYIGDSIMAVWGTAVTSGSPAVDAWNAVKTALLMRVALYDFNLVRYKEGKETIRIGCGINTGHVVAGQIGSSERMEYTVIGDAVNLASRTEALNKPFATDILITENTYELIKDKVIVEKMPPVHVKGKEQTVNVYAVINAVGVKGPASIYDLRDFLGVQNPDLSKVDTDEEEKKYQLQNSNQ